MRCNIDNKRFVYVCTGQETYLAIIPFHYIIYWGYLIWHLFAKHIRFKSLHDECVYSTHWINKIFYYKFNSNKEEDE